MKSELKYPKILEIKMKNRIYLSIFFTLSAILFTSSLGGMLVGYIYTLL